MIADLFIDLEQDVNLFGDSLFLFQGTLENIDRIFEFRLRLRDRIERHGCIAIDQMLVEFMSVHRLFEALVIYPTGETGIEGLLKPSGHGEIGVAESHLVIDLVVQQFG